MIISASEELHNNLPYYFLEKYFSCGRYPENFFLYQTGVNINKFCHSILFERMDSFIQEIL